MRNLRLLCHAHNVLAAEQAFGAASMRRAMAPPDGQVPRAAPHWCAHQSSLALASAEVQTHG